MQAKQLVGAAAFGLVLSSTGMVQAGGVTDAATGAIRESVHGKADSMMDSVGLGKGKAAAEEGAAADAKSAAGEKAAPAESAAEGDVAKDAAAGGDAAKDAAAEGAESAKKSAGDAIPEVPKPSVEDAAKETAKGALKGLLD